MTVNLEKSKYSLLYVEDEVAMREVTVMFLKHYFTEIYEASNGLEALEIYKEKKPDVIMTDIEMPKMNGLEFCRGIREVDKSTPIMITTAYTSVEYLLEAVSLNLIKYLAKPLKEVEVLEALQTCFGLIASESPNIIQITKELSYDMFNQSLSTKDTIIPLSLYQSMLLDILIKNSHRIVYYVEIENSIWEDKVMSQESLRTLVRKLRKIVGEGVIENISKSGYKINLYA
ncbi:MAG TPA: response regulator [Campylobacterales bacterium]|nr:response regulator [Campylobacterales bacterium]